MVRPFTLGALHEPSVRVRVRPFTSVPSINQALRLGLGLGLGPSPSVPSMSQALALGSAPCSSRYNGGVSGVGPTRGVAVICTKLRPLPLGPALLSPGVTVQNICVPPRRPTGLPVLRQILTVPPMPWQLAAATRLAPARTVAQGKAVMAPAAILPLLHRTPIIALALAQLPQIHELAA